MKNLSIIISSFFLLLSSVSVKAAMTSRKTDFQIPFKDSEAGFKVKIPNGKNDFCASDCGDQRSSGQVCHSDDYIENYVSEIVGENFETPKSDTIDGSDTGI